MRFEHGIKAKYRAAIEDAFAAIRRRGNDFHREMMQEIEASELMIRCGPVSEVNASGRAGLISPIRTNALLLTERLSLRDAMGEVYIVIAEETIDTGGKRGCEGTFVHEGRHAYDFALALESISNADMNPIGIFDPTLYELEWNAHETAAEYMLCVQEKEYLDEGVDLMILGLGDDGACFLSKEGIQQRLREGYGLSLDGDQGRTASRMLGIVV
jgi:hypothetical protein